MDDIIKIVKSEESSLLIKGVGKTIKTKSKEQKRFLRVIRYIRCYFIKKSVNR